MLLPFCLAHMICGRVRGMPDFFLFYLSSKYSYKCVNEWVSRGGGLCLNKSLDSLILGAQHIIFSPLANCVLFLCCNGSPSLCFCTQCVLPGHLGPSVPVYDGWDLGRWSCIPYGISLPLQENVTFSDAIKPNVLTPQHSSEGTPRYSGSAWDTFPNRH